MTKIIAVVAVLLASAAALFAAEVPPDGEGPARVVFNCPPLVIMQQVRNEANLAVAQGTLLRSAQGELGRDAYMAARKKIATLYLRALAALLSAGVPARLQEPKVVGGLYIEGTGLSEKQVEAQRKRQAEIQDAWIRYFAERDNLTGQWAYTTEIESLYGYPPYATEELRDMALGTLRSPAEVNKIISAVQATIAETTKNGPLSPRYSTEPAAEVPATRATATLGAVRRLVDQSTDACLRYLDAAEPDRAAARREYATLNLKALGLILQVEVPNVPKALAKVPKIPSISNPQHPTEADQAAQKKFDEDLAAWREAYNKSLLSSELGGYHQALVGVICDTYTMPPPATDELRELATATLNNEAVVEDLVSTVNKALAREAAEPGEVPPAAPSAPAAAPAVPPASLPAATPTVPPTKE